MRLPGHFPGFWGYLHRAKKNHSDDSGVCRQGLHLHFYPGNVAEMVCLWIRQVFYQCLVLAGFPHCGCMYSILFNFSGEKYHLEVCRVKGNIVLMLIRCSVFWLNWISCMFIILHNQRNDRTVQPAGSAGECPAHLQNSGPKLFMDHYVQRKSFHPLALSELESAFLKGLYGEAVEKIEENV